MKYGFRTPSFKKSFSARTKGRMTRSLKRSVNPYYGKKGMGWVNNPKKAAYNAVYHRTTKSVWSGNSSKGVSFTIALIVLIVFALIGIVSSNSFATLAFIGMLAFMGFIFWGVYKIRHTRKFKNAQANSEAYFEKHPVLYAITIIASIAIIILFKFVLK